MVGEAVGRRGQRRAQEWVWDDALWGGELESDRLGMGKRAENRPQWGRFYAVYLAEQCLRATVTPGF
jgi:hypothetical protein